MIVDRLQMIAHRIIVRFPGWVMTLHINILIADVFSNTASASFGTSRFGIMLVYKLPGPIKIASASRIASTASGSGSTSSGSRKIRLIFPEPREFSIRR